MKDFLIEKVFLIYDGDLIILINYGEVKLIP